MKNPSLLLASLLLMQACGDGKQQAAEQATGTDTTATPAVSNEPAVDLAEYDLPLAITFPPAQLTGGAQPQLAWYEEEGYFGVKAGEHFGLRITEEPGDVARLKADLDRDLVRKNSLVTDTPELIVYQSQFPDDPSLVFMHFYQVLKAGDRTFVVESDPDGRFNATDIDRMRTAVATKSPA